MVLKDFDWEHEHKFELEVSGHTTWWKCDCSKIAFHPEVMAALVDAVERIRELEKAAKDHVEYVQQNSGCPTTIEEVRRGAYLFEQLEKALSDKSNQKD